MRHRISCTSLSFPRLDLTAACATIAGFGLHKVDLCIAEGDREIDVRLIESDPNRALRTTQTALRSAGLTVSDVFVILNQGRDDRPLNDPSPTVRKQNRRRLQHVVEFAAAVGGTGLTILPGNADTNADLSDEQISRSAAELRSAVSVAGEQGVALSVEPHVGSVMNSPDLALSMVEAVPGLGLTLDYSHFVAQGIDVGAVSCLHPFVRHVHVRQARPGCVQTPSADGVIPFDRVVDELEATGYSGDYSIEYVESPWHLVEPVDVADETRNAAIEISRYVGRDPH